MSAPLEWHKAPSGTGFDARFAFGVMQLRQRFGEYQVIFVPYPEFQHVQESETDRADREALFSDRYTLMMSRAVAQGMVLGMLERDTRKQPAVEDPIVRQVVELLQQSSRKLSKAEILSLTGFSETQWQHFLTHRPAAVSLESHGRGARYGVVGNASATSPAHDLAKIPVLRFTDYVGNLALRERLQQYIRAAASRREPLDHTLLSGPPGVGKTMLAEIIAGEMGKPFHHIWATKVTNIDDSLREIPDHSVVFIDEIHALSPSSQEQLYSHLKRPITIIGATNYPSRLLPAFQERFPIKERLELYDEQDLAELILRSNTTLARPIAQEIARRSRGTPREALRLVRRLADLGGLKEDTIGAAFDKLEIDLVGLSRRDRDYLAALAQSSNPVGVDTLATTLNESPDVLEQQIEPFLLQQGFIERGSRGRTITDKGRDHLRKGQQTKRRAPRGRPAQPTPPTGQGAEPAQQEMPV